MAGSVYQIAVLLCIHVITALQDMVAIKIVKPLRIVSLPPLTAPLTGIVEFFSHLICYLPPEIILIPLFLANPL